MNNKKSSTDNKSSTGSWIKEDSKKNGHLDRLIAPRNDHVFMVPCTIIMYLNYSEF